MGIASRKQSVITPKILAKVSGIDKKNPRTTVCRVATESGLKATHVSAQNSVTLSHTQGSCATKVGFCENDGNND